jgi:outer membrane immunogenic protein
MGDSFCRGIRLDEVTENSAVEDSTMKRFVLATTLLIAAGMTVPAFAADMPVKAAMPVGFDWSGIYVGGHIGGGWATSDIAVPGLGIIGTILGVPTIQTTNSSGFLGGGQIGSNYQIGKLVIGWEGDASWSQINGTSTSTFVPLLGLGGGGGSFSRALASNTDWTATLTTRIGIAHDHTLFYGKAGTAIAHTNYTDNWTANPGGPFFSGSGGETREGWTTGVGIEYAFTNSLSFKAEYDYMNFGSRTANINGTILGAPFSAGIQNNLQISEVKAGLNFRVMPNFW